MELHKNWRCESHSVLIGVSNFCPYLPHEPFRDQSPLRRGSRTFYARRNPFTFFPPEAISWWLADFGLRQEGEGYDLGHLRRSVVTLRDSNFGIRLRRFSWIWLGQPRRKDAAWDPRRLGRRLRYVRTKFIIGWWILNSVLFCVLRHTGRLCYCCLVSSVTLFEPVLRTRGTGEVGDFWIEWGFGILLFVILLSCDLLYCYFVESKKACLVFMVARALHWM